MNYITVINVCAQCDIKCKVMQNLWKLPTSTQTEGASEWVLRRICGSQT